MLDIHTFSKVTFTVSTKLVAGIAMNSIWARQNVDFMTEKLNISRPSLKVTIHQP